VLPLEGSDSDHPKVGKPEAFLRTAANERDPAFSPDGRWIAYSSDDSGAFEIYVRPFPGPGSKSRVSIAGGRLPIWSRSGRELAYQTLDDRIMMTAYTVNGDSFAPGKPRVWSDQRIVNSSAAGQTNMDLSPDGKRFAVLLPAHSTGVQSSPGEVTFLLNFFDELRRRAPVGK